MATPFATKIIGETGAQLTSTVPEISGNPKTDTWTGPTVTLETWSQEVLATQYPKMRVAVSISNGSGGISTMTVTDAGDGSDEGGQDTADDARTPTLTIAMGTYPRPIETLTSPTNFTSISVARASAIRKLVQTADEAGITALTGTEAAYANALVNGIMHRADPCYQASATRYIRLNKDFKATVGSMTSIVGWSDVVAWLGNEKAKYANPDPSLKWRATGLTIAIREGKYAEVSKTFEGANWWPSYLYG